MQTIITLLLLAASPDAAASTNTEAPASMPAKPAKVKKICRAGAATGSRMTSKICKTQSEWDSQIGADATKIDKQRGSGSGY